MSFLDDILGLVSGVSGITDLVFTTIQDGELLVENIRLEVRKLKEFKINPAFRTRVINADRAVSQVRESATGIGEQISDAFHSFTTAIRAIRQTAQLESEADPAHKSAGVLRAISEIKEVIIELDLLFKALNGLVDAIRQIRDQLQTFDALFLPQSNPRRREKLTEGGFIKIRVGSLHS
jgi:hypothetical protein